MKIILFLFLLTSLSVTGQTVPLALRMDLVTWLKLENKDYLAGGKRGTLEIKVRNYDVYQVSASGQYYINFITTSGTTSRKYLGYKGLGTQEYQGNTIFYNNDTTQAWIWTIDRYGQLFKMDLPDYFSKYARIIK